MNPIEKIDRLLEKHGMSTRALSDATGIPANRISKWRRVGEGKPTNAELGIIADYFRVPRSFMLDPSITEIPEPDLSESERAAIKVIRALGLPEEEVLRRLYQERAKLEPTAPVAAHRGEAGTPPRGESEIRAKRENATGR